MTLDTSLNAGVASRKQLLALGMTDAQLARLCQQREIARIRPGWYARTGAHPKVRHAVAAGCVLTGSDALALHGAWNLSRSTIHVRNHQLTRIRTSTGIVPHTLRPSPPCDAAVDPISAALAVLWKDEPLNDAVIICDSLLNRGLVSMCEVQAIAEAYPRTDNALQLLDPASESGTETWFRLWARRHRLKLRSQVWIPGVGRVDFLIGSRLIVECDSVAHHTSLDAYERDRARDLALKALGFEVVRLTYRQILELETGLGVTILAMIRRGMHRRQPRSLTGRQKSVA